MGGSVRRVPYVLAATPLLVAFSTALIFVVDPSPSFFLHVGWVDEILARLFREQVDRFILLAWWAIVAAMSLVAVKSVRGRSGELSHRRAVRWLAAALILVVTMVTLWGVMWKADSHGVWPGIGFAGIAIGFGVYALFSGIWLSSRSVAVALSLVVTGTALVVALPGLMQTPSSLLDPFHFTFIADEIAAPAAGKFPLSDYVPQYVTLLGWPVAPLLYFMGDQAVLGVTAWLVILQIMAFAVGVWWAVLLGGWRLAAPALVLVLGPSLVFSDSFPGPISYFQTSPARIVLPVVALFLTYMLLQNSFARRSSSFLLGLSIGAAAGIAALNNPDYGVPAAVAIALTTLLALRPVRRALLIAGTEFVGAVAVFAAYDVVGRLSGHTVDWRNWIVFQVVYGAQGHAWAEPIRPFGLHIVVVALFASATVLGVSLTIFGMRAGRPWARRQGISLSLVGSWSLLCLPYFVGRSLVPTLVGGYAFMMGLTGVLLLPSIRSALRVWRMNGQRFSWEQTTAVVIGGLTVTGVGAFWILAPAPSSSLDRQFTKASSWVEDLASGGNVKSALLSDSAPSDAVQALPMASLVQLATGVKSASVPSNPLHFTTDPVFVAAECKWLSESTWSQIWLEEMGDESMRVDPTCQEVVDFESPIAVSNDVTLYPRRR